MRATTVTVVAGYLHQIEMTREFLDTLEAMKPPLKSGLKMQVILVNASADKPGDPRIDIEHPIVDQRIDLEHNVSFANTMNAGIRRATGDFVIVMNNDAFPKDPNWIPELVKHHMLTGAAILTPEINNPAAAFMRKLEDHGSYTEWSMYPAVCWMLPRKTIWQVGLFDERFTPAMYEDNDYYMRVKEVGGFLVEVHTSKVHHRGSVESNASINKAIALSVNRTRFLSKWEGKL